MAESIGGGRAKSHIRERVSQCEALGENAIAEVIRDILRVEQEHRVDLATALNKSVPMLTAKEPAAWRA